MIDITTSAYYTTTIIASSCCSCSRSCWCCCYRCCPGRSPGFGPCGNLCDALCFLGRGAVFLPPSLQLGPLPELFLSPVVHVVIPVPVLALASLYLCGALSGGKKSVSVLQGLMHAGDAIIIMTITDGKDMATMTIHASIQSVLL